jgi:hypothetical protein
MIHLSLFPSFSLTYGKGVVFASAIGSATTIPWFTIASQEKRGSLKVMSAGVGRVERKPLDPKGKERNGSLWIRKRRSDGVDQVERKHPDLLFISRRPDTNISPFINLCTRTHP